MKEATGELSMTVVTIIAVVAIAGIITFILPSVRNYINDAWMKTSDTTIKGAEAVGGKSGNK